jgi:Protein of unknown function (DUF4231)
MPSDYAAFSIGRTAGSGIAITPLNVPRTEAYQIQEPGGLVSSSAIGAGDPIRIGYTPGQDVSLDRLQDQIEWYDRRSGSNQKAFKYLKICTISAAAVIPVFARIDWMSWFTVGLGIFIVVLEGLQQIYQYHSNWISYRSTCEALKHEKFLYLAKAGIYATASDAHALLAERIESLVSQEHAKWASSQEQGRKVSPPPGPEA